MWFSSVQLTIALAFASSHHMQAPLQIISLAIPPSGKPEELLWRNKSTTCRGRRNDWMMLDARFAHEWF